jgi:hypothetical protein
MGFKEGNFPPVDPAVFLNQPLRARMRRLAEHWVEYGFGTARNINVIYIFKIVVFYAFFGVLIATAGVAPFWEVGSWYNQIGVYQKLVVWTVLLEAMNLAGSWGPLAGKFKPMMGGFLFWSKVGQIRLRPFKWVPFTSGYTRTPLDVTLYFAFLLSLVAALAIPLSAGAGSFRDGTQGFIGFDAGVVNPTIMVVTMVIWVLMGLRDKISFLASRAEQYMPVFLFSVVLPMIGDYTDMIIALKLTIIVSWVGAAISKFGRHFTNTVAPMVSNTPFWAPLPLKRAMYRDFPNDLRPSKFASLFAHIPGTVLELIAPLVLLFSLNSTVTWVAAIAMVAFCLFIISTFPLAVPLEWNILFAFTAIALFIGFPAQAGFAVTDFSQAWIGIVVIALLVFFPILGNLRPDKISFLVSMRQYAGNWATSLWTFTPGGEAKLAQIKRPAEEQINQLQAIGVPYVAAEITMQQTIAWRSTQSQGRGLFSALYKYLPDIESRTIRDGEFASNAMHGFNFGDSHMHSPELVAYLHERCNFEPGEFIQIWAESQPIHKGTQHWILTDAATGKLAEGYWNVKEAVNEQPWLPNGPINLDETFKRPEAEWPKFNVDAKPEFWQPTDTAVGRVVDEAEAVAAEAASVEAGQEQPKA